MIVIDATSPVPPFEQLRAQLARQIQDRTLAVGARLPTIRHLAADLGLAVSEVQPGDDFRDRLISEVGAVLNRTYELPSAQPSGLQDLPMAGITGISAGPAVSLRD